MNIFKELYNYRELLKTNVKKEVRGRYKNSFLGVLWSFLNPLLQLAVYSIIFGSLLGGGDPTYHIYVCVALIPWTYFSSAVQFADYTVIANRKYNTKGIFPKRNITNICCNKWSNKLYNIYNNYTCILFVFRAWANLVCTTLSSSIASAICFNIRNIFYSIFYNCIYKRFRTHYRSSYDGSILRYTYSI